MWLAIQVSSLFSLDKNNAKNLRQRTIVQEFATVMNVWQAASPKISYSNLRYTISHTSSIFSSSLHGLVGASFDSLKPDLIAKTDLDKIKQATINSILKFLPEKESEHTYLFEIPANNFATALNKYCAVHDKEDELLVALVEACQKLKTSPAKPEALLKEIANRHLGDQILIGNYLKFFFINANMKPEEISILLNEYSWRDNIFKNMLPIVIEPILEGLREIIIQHAGNLSYSIPHYIALECENAKEDKKEQLFAYLIYMSLAGNTVSAIKRLLSGNNKYLFKELTDTWTDHFKNLIDWSPDWIKGRIRYILTALRI